jgi:arsenite/tail-anchored protein-transporting ATPase
MLSFIDNPTRHLFFTGKGGVGKTSIATATAIALADAGKRVLLVSTDPASNLGQVLETEVDERVLPVDVVPRLCTLNIDPEAAAGAYRDRVLAPVRGKLPDAAVSQIEEQLSGACTTEIAAFDEFTQLLTNPEHEGRFDHIVFDTAPTGHTLRLLQLPSAWSTFIDENPDGASCLGPLSGLSSQQAQYSAAVKALNDGEQTTLILVSRPEAAALEEADRSSAELEQLGITNQRLVINGVFRASDPEDPFALAMERRAEAALATMPERLASFPTEHIPLKGHNLVGVAALRGLLTENDAIDSSEAEGAPYLPVESLLSLVDEIEADGKGLVMTLGKGGVGKTTIAAAIAVELARRGHDVHLSTTDPAAHIASAVNGEIEHLTISTIDPREETKRYVDQVMATKGKDLDEDGRKLLQEDLRSPCTEEVAVFHAFSKLVREAARSFVVLDTAPTGHTLLLMDQTGAYHREVIRNTKINPDRVTTPLMRLQDPSYTKLLIVTLPETTPVLEAAQLQADLRRAQIEPYAWVINQSLAAGSTTDPLLAQRARAEAPQIQAVAERHAQRTFIAPWTTFEPVGSDALSALIRGHAHLEPAEA